MNKNNIPDKEIRKIVLLASKGDDSAFARLLSIYAPLVSSEVNSFTGCGADADDIRQEAFIAFFQAVKTYDFSNDSVSFGLYAKVCIKNRLISAVSRFSSEKFLADFEGVGEGDYGYPLSEYDPYEFYVNRLDFDILKSKLSALLSVYEKTVLNYYIAGFSHSEIADRIGKSERSVSNALFRIRGKLKCLLDDRK